MGPPIFQRQHRSCIEPIWEESTQLIDNYNQSYSITGASLPPIAKGMTNKQIENTLQNYALNAVTTQFGFDPTMFTPGMLAKQLPTIGATTPFAIAAAGYAIKEGYYQKYLKSIDLPVFNSENFKAKLGVQINYQNMQGRLAPQIQYMPNSNVSVIFGVQGTVADQGELFRHLGVSVGITIKLNF